MNTDFTPIEAVLPDLTTLRALPLNERQRLCRMTLTLDRGEYMMVENGELGKIHLRKNVSPKLANTLRLMAKESRA
jgi:hypothetical protein